MCFDAAGLLVDILGLQFVQFLVVSFGLRAPSLHNVFAALLPRLLLFNCYLFFEIEVFLNVLRDVRLHTIDGYEMHLVGHVERHVAVFFVLMP